MEKLLANSYVSYIFLEMYLELAWCFNIQITIILVFCTLRLHLQLLLELVLVISGKDFLLKYFLDKLMLRFKNLVFYFVGGGICKGGWESRRFMLTFYCIFFWKRLSLMFHPSYQNGGKILSIETPSVGRRWLRN